MREKKLLAGFSTLLILTAGIGIFGIVQINSLTGALHKLSGKYLRRETTILEIKRNNSLYTLAVRNFAFWRTSKYLGAAAVASDVSLMERSRVELTHYLKMYESLVTQGEEKGQVELAYDYIRELEDSGKKIVKLVDSEAQDKENINKLLAAFENQSFKIDNFLTETLSKGNLSDIQRQLSLANNQKRTSVVMLFLSLLVSIALGIAITCIVYNSLKLERLRRQFLVQKMISIEEEERRRLSAEVHDQLSQDLSGLKIFLELIEQAVPTEQNEQRQRIEKCRKILADLMDKSHNISQMLRPPELDELGLIESISSLISEYKDLTGYNFHYHKPEGELKLPPEHSLLLYRVAQEALTNIAKYAKPKNVDVSLGMKANAVFLAVNDDGIGFDYAGLNHLRRRREDKLKLGLYGLKERVELLDGIMRIDTSLGKGTRITVELPV